MAAHYGSANKHDRSDEGSPAHQDGRRRVDSALILFSGSDFVAIEALFVLAITSEMRRGEILALKWQDIQFEYNTLQVRRIFTRRPGNRYIEAEPKTEKSRRSILLAPIVVTLLKQHRARQREAKLKAGSQWQDQDLVFLYRVRDAA